MNIAPIFRLVKKKPVASGGAEIRSFHPDKKNCRFLTEQKKPTASDGALIIPGRKLSL